MSEVAYVSLAGAYAKRIRSGELPAGTQLPSYAEISQRENVSDIIVRKAIDLLELQGLVRRVRRRGIFVAEWPGLIRVSPERQLETAEDTFKHESDQDVVIDREIKTVEADRFLQEVFKISDGDEVTLTITRASEDGQAVSISDTYQPLGVTGISEAKFLEESISDRIPSPSHGNWLKTSSSDLVKRVHQKFYDSNENVIMVSDISYPRHRYDTYTFRMGLELDQALIQVWA